MSQRYKFLLRFAVLIVGLYALVTLKSVNDHVIVPYTNSLATVSAALMRLGGQEVTARDALLSSARFSAEIRNGCNGVEAAVLLIAAIGAFPARLSRRAGGIVVGLALIQVVNVVRVILLFWVGVHFRALFDLMHVVVWQVVVIALTVLYFLLWSARLERIDPTTPA